MHLTPNLGILELADWWRSENIFQAPIISRLLLWTCFSLAQQGFQPTFHQLHKVYQRVNGKSWINYVLNYDPSAGLCISLVHMDLIVCRLRAHHSPHSHGTSVAGPLHWHFQAQTGGVLCLLRTTERSRLCEFFCLLLFSVLHRTTPDITPTVSLHLQFLSLPCRLKVFKLRFRHAFSCIIICILANVGDRRGAAEGGFSCVVSPRACLISSTVQQTPVCAHRTGQPLLQRRPVGVGGHSSDLWQIPRKERRAKGAVWERPPEFFLPHKVLGEFCQIFAGRARRKLISFNIAVVR